MIFPFQITGYEESQICNGITCKYMLTITTLEFTCSAMNMEFSHVYMLERLQMGILRSICQWAKYFFLGCTVDCGYGYTTMSITKII